MNALKFAVFVEKLFSRSGTKHYWNFLFSMFTFLYNFCNIINLSTTIQNNVSISRKVLTLQRYAHHFALNHFIKSIFCVCYGIFRDVFIFAADIIIVIHFYTVPFPV